MESLEGIDGVPSGISAWTAGGILTISTMMETFEVLLVDSLEELVKESLELLMKTRGESQVNFRKEFLEKSLQELLVKSQIQCIIQCRQIGCLMTDWRDEKLKNNSLLLIYFYMAYLTTLKLREKANRLNTKHG